MLAGGSPVLFREVQRFRQWIFWVPLLVVTGVIWWQFAEQIVLGRPQGQNPVPDWVAWILAVVFGLGFPAFGAVIRLITEVTADSINVGLAPFRLRRIPLSAVDTAMEREYTAMREFGGWGIRTSRHGRAYNAYGNKGVQLVLNDESRILIGTQRAEELISALRLGGVEIVR